MDFLYKALCAVTIFAVSKGAIPNDSQILWPAPSQLDLFSADMKGDILFPKTLGYWAQTTMKNTRWNSRFGLVLMAETTEDVQKAILFCKEYGIRPTVRSSGHDYIGRASGDHTLSINLGRMKKLEVQNDSRSETGKSCIVEPGNIWSDVYKKLDKEGYLIVGGSAPSVSPGGYTLGGGHSPMSRSFGLGVDNVIEFTLVTPSGSIIKLTKDGGTIQQPGSSTPEPYSDPELFWAVRGGGGGTFGIVTSITFQVHSPPNDGFCHFLAIYPMDIFGYKIGKDILEKFGTYLRYNMTDNWGGYVVFSPETSYLRPHLPYNIPIPQNVTINGYLLFSLLHVGGCEKATPGLEFLWDMYPSFVLHRQKVEHDTFWEYEKNVNDPTGYRVYIINRFLQPADMEEPEKMATVFSQMVDGSKPIGGTWTLLGGKVSRIRTSSSSASSTFRSALASASIGVGWEDAKEDGEHISALRKYGEKLYTIGDGVYFNEPDEFLENWKEEYWGSMEVYNRLLAVKQRMDKDNMFWCLHCVGSDLSGSDQSLNVHKPIFAPVAYIDGKFRSMTTPSSAGIALPSLITMVFVLGSVYVL